MEELKPIEVGGVKEKVSLEVLIFQQISRVNHAITIGNVQQIGSSISALSALLMPEMTEKEIVELNSVEYMQLSIQDLYTEEDKAHLEKFTGLIRTRRKELEGMLHYQNKQHFNICVRTQLSLLMKVIKKLGLGLQSEGAATISHKPEECDYFGKELLKQVKTNLFVQERNWLCLISGSVGTGKSYAGMEYALSIDPTFNVDRVVFDKDSFLELVYEKDLPHGACILADETGAWFGSRDYMSNANKMLSRVIQTFRHKRLVVIWTCPLLRQLDVNIRSMADCTIETQRVLRRAKKTLTKYKYSRINSQARDGEPLRPHPLIKHPKTGFTYRISQTYFGLIPESLSVTYEKKKKEALQRSYEKDKQLSQKLENKGKYAPTKKEQVSSMLQRGVDVGTITKAVGCDRSYVNKLKKELN